MGRKQLTNGVDCSGFVHQVYAHFGISTPRYSQAFKSVGQPVSYQNIQAGDVVVYPGHVAIYIGNGNIVGGAVNKSRNYKQPSGELSYNYRNPQTGIGVFDETKTSGIHCSDCSCACDAHEK